MAASVQDHFHLVDSATPGNTTTDGEWKALAPNLKPQAAPIPSIRAFPTTALDGTRRFHVLKDGANPVLYVDWQILVKCETWADYETLKGYLGKTKYLIPHYHDPNAHNSYTQKVQFHYIGEIKSPGPTMPTLWVPITLLDASN